jgi:photosystem II stability/assembly factor-like uncharacterized protein
MQDIDFDGDFGLAVGTDSTIFTTTNGGITWNPRVPAHGTKNLLSALVVPGTSGQVMYAGGNDLFFTNDGGASWFNAYNDIDSVFKIQALDNGVILALGDDYGIYTVDNGIFWQPFNYPGENITAGHFLTPQMGWVQFGTFNNNQVWITKNSGMDWELRDTTKYGLITQIYMVDSLNGYMSTLGEVLRTSDGGYHWEILNAHPSASITDMHVVNASTIWTVLDNGFVNFTITSGGDWHEVNPNIINSDQPLGIWANDQGQAWIVGKYVSVLYTPDFGMTWTDQIPNSKETLFRPYFSSNAKGIVGGSDGTIMLTDNGGAIWETSSLSQDENLFAAYRQDDSTLVVGSSSGRIFISYDRGIHWDTLAEGLGSITDMVVFDLDTLLVTTEQGRVYRTTNGVVNWNIVYNNPTTPLYGIEFISAQRGWAVGYGGHIIFTEDQGIHWTTKLNEGHAQFVDVDFVDELAGWAVASHLSDTIWFTKDGGDTWNKWLLPVTTFWHGVSFMSPDTGWITGGSAGHGVVLRTNDRGVTWTLDHTSPEALLGIFAVPNEELVWAVGFGGNIMRYSNCNFPPAISGLAGLQTPCVGDTVTYTIQSSDVDIFSWSFPSDWLVLGNTNQALIQVIAGSMNGQIFVHGSNVCDQYTDSLYLDLFPNPLPEAHINNIKGILVVNLDSGFYQWLLNGEPISGAVDQSFTPTESGTYSAMFTSFATGCSVVTNSIEVTIVSTTDPEQDQFYLYPNPGSGQVYLRQRNGKPVEEGEVKFFQTNGMEVGKAPLNSTGLIDISTLQPGLYFISMTTQADRMIIPFVVQ